MILESRRGLLTPEGILETLLFTSLVIFHHSIFNGPISFNTFEIVHIWRFSSTFFFFFFRKLCLCVYRSLLIGALIESSVSFEVCKYGISVGFLRILPFPLPSFHKISITYNHPIVGTLAMENYHILHLCKKPISMVIHDEPSIEASELME